MTAWGNVIAATGHRPAKIGGHGPEARHQARTVARHALEALAPSEVITGMAQGWDTAVALAALDAGLPLTCALPFAGQELRWPAEDRHRYHLILGRAQHVEVVSPGGYSNYAMFARNRWMVDRCGMLLACWDGVRSGGTAHCLDYADRMGRPWLNLFDRLPSQLGQRF